MQDIETYVVYSPATLKRARVQAGLSQRQLAELSGVSQQSIMNYELGRIDASARKLRMLAVGLGVRWVLG